MKFGRAQGKMDEEIRVCGIPYTLVAVIFHGPGHYVCNLRFLDTSSSGDFLAGDDPDRREGVSGWCHYDDMPPRPFPFSRRGELFAAAGPYVLPQSRRGQRYRPTVWYYATMYAATQHPGHTGTVVPGRFRGHLQMCHHNRQPSGCNYE